MKQYLHVFSLPFLFSFLSIKPHEFEIRQVPNRATYYADIHAPTLLNNYASHQPNYSMLTHQRTNEMRSLCTGVAPISSSSCKNAYQNAVDALWPHQNLRSKFLEQHKAILATLDRMLYQHEREAQLMVIDLRYQIDGLADDVQKDLNEPLKELTIKLQHIIFDADGTFRGICDTNRQHEAATAYVAFLKTINPDHYFQEIKKRSDNGNPVFRYVYEEEKSFRTRLINQIKHIFSKLPSDISAKIKNNSFNKDLINLICACKDERWNDAQTLVNNHSKCKHRPLINNVYNSYYAKRALPVPMDECPIITHSDGLDLGKITMVDLLLTTPTPSDYFEKHVRANPRTDFHTFTQEVLAALEELEKELQLHDPELYAEFQCAKTIVLFIKDALKGISEHCAYVMQHPDEYAKDFIRGNIELLKIITSLLDDGLDIESVRTHEQLQAYEQRIRANHEPLIALYNNIAQAVPHMSLEDWGKLTGRLFADFLICKGVGKACGATKLRIIATLEDNPLINKIEEAFSKRPKVVTPEGVALESNSLSNTSNILKYNTQEIELGRPSLVTVQKEVSAVKHNFKYHSRVRARALQDPVAHNFPYTFDDIILKSKPIIQKDGSLLFRHTGFLNGKEGFFEIAVNNENKIIFHRTFIGKK